MTEVEIAWLAGLLEGEGTFLLCSRRREGEGHRPRIVVKVKMTDSDVIEKAARLMGREAPPYKNNPPSSASRGHAPTWIAEVSSAKAETVMRAILPYMGKRRRARIEELLATKGLSHHD